jgi:protein-disulfide isomerase
MEEKMQPDANLPEESTGTSRKTRRNGLVAVGGIFILVIIAVVFVLPHLKNMQSWKNGSSPSSTSTNPAPMDAAPSIGAKDAPVTIIEYGDFGCPSCWYWYRQGTLDKLLNKYGDNLRIVWRDYAVITRLSPVAAEAGQCANDQGKFWEFHDVVYSSEGAIEMSDLKSYATQIGLDMNQFDDCLGSHRYHDRVLAEQTEAFTHGYNGAPFFLVNDQLVVGPQSYSYFSNLIDQILAGAN